MPGQRFPDVFNFSGIWRPPSDAVVKLSDNAGATAFSIHDSDDAEVAYIDSDGNIWAAGSSTIEVDELVEGTLIIDVTDTEALLVRKDSDGGDVFTVDTTNSRVIVGGDVLISATSKLYLDGGGNTYIYEKIADQAVFYAGGQDILYVGEGSNLGTVAIGITPSITSKLLIGGTANIGAGNFGLFVSYTGSSGGVAASFAGIRVAPTYNQTDATGATKGYITGVYVDALDVDITSGAVTDVAGIYIEGAPTVTGSGSATSLYALKVASGDSYFGGNLNADGSVIMMGSLPTSDPSNTGQLWNDSGTVKVSA